MDEPRIYWDPIHAVLGPPKRLMRSIKMAGKLAIVVGLFAVPLTYLMYVSWTRASNELQTARLELAGSALAPLLVDLGQAVNGNAVTAPSALGAIGQKLTATGDPLKVRPAFEAVEKQWKANEGAADKAKAAREMGEKVGALWEAVIMGSGMVLDPDVDTYHQMLGFSQALPQVNASFHELAVIASHAEGGKLEPAEAYRAAGLSALILRDAEVIKSALFDIKEANAEAGKRLAPTEGWVPAYENLAKQVSESLAGGKEGLATFAALGASFQSASIATSEEAKRWATEFDAGVTLRADKLNTTRWVTLAFAALAAALAVYLLLGFWMALRGGIIAIRGSLERIGAGDLTSAADVEGSDEISLALHAIHEMQQNLARTMRDLRHVSDSLGTAGGEIASGNQDLASRTEEQAASIQQTSSSIRELDDAVQRNVGSAGKASELVAEASRVANAGGKAVEGVVKTMEDIQASSRKIAEIISVIDGIAFQTNILALNAAVEAARAGEQGRGFAVVASEVRALAQRSATAAHEIKGLIEDSTHAVDHGARQVKSTTATIHEVVVAVERAARLMEEIALASREQGEGISEVSKAVGQMDGVTQQNSALVEEMAAASESLKGQARSLVEVVSRFRVGDAGFAAA